MKNPAPNHKSNQVNINIIIRIRDAADMLTNHKCRPITVPPNRPTGDPASNMHPRNISYALIGLC